jgi:competence protein ComEA
VNLAQLLGDDQQITVPRKPEEQSNIVYADEVVPPIPVIITPNYNAPAPSSAGESAQGYTDSDGQVHRKVNINTADKPELMTLPGIGDARATMIIAYRQTRSFNRIEEIMNVSGIGIGIFELVKDLIVVN